MLIAVAGPYSADSEEQRQRNLALLNEAATHILRIGNSPGADREQDLIESKGLPVYGDVGEIPAAS